MCLKRCLTIAVSLDKAVICRQTISGQKFEILVDPEKALEFKHGKAVSMDDILAYPAIYKDARSTDLVAEEDLQKNFGTTDVYKIAESIIKKGELQLTTEQRRKFVENKRMQIAEIISRRGINPQTNAPHPPQRILNAMEKAGVNVDPFTEAELQVNEVLKRIRAIIPIKFQRVTLQLKFPPRHAGRVYTILKSLGSIKNEKWLNDGSLQIDVEVLAGVQSELFEKLSKLTHGEFESKTIEKEDVE